MQTFLPCRSFESSACVLDYRRLGKQRVEARQILAALQPEATSRWRNHPAVHMWRGYEQALIVYSNVMILEWQRRGYQNNMALLSADAPIALPPWLGEEKLHASHRSNLLRKDPVWYGQFGWTVPPDMPYYWPVRRAS